MEITKIYCYVCRDQGCDKCRKDKFLRYYNKLIEGKTKSKYGCYCSDTESCIICKYQKERDKDKQEIDKQLF